MDQAQTLTGRHYERKHTCRKKAPERDCLNALPDRKEHGSICLQCAIRPLALRPPVLFAIFPCGAYE